MPHGKMFLKKYKNTVVSTRKKKYRAIYEKQNVLRGKSLAPTWISNGTPLKYVDGFWRIMLTTLVFPYTKVPSYCKRID